MKTHIFKVISKISAVMFLGLLSSCINNKTEEKKIEINKAVFDLSTMKSQVFTTAHDTTFRLSPTGSIEFKTFKQPLETDASIIVDPTKQFQTFMGIGAALTDASAETFYKLSKESQDLFMEAYYNVDKGIGYSLARTIIHSCDFSSGSYTLI